MNGNDYNIYNICLIHIIFKFKDLLRYLQLQEIFGNIGVTMNCETFNRLYDIAEKESSHGEVSVESFRRLLDQCHEKIVDKNRRCGVRY